MIRSVEKLWPASAAVFGSKERRRTFKRVLFCLRAVAQYSSTQAFLEAPANSPLGQLLRERPETIGALIWPYQCSTWDARTRLSQIRAHYEEISDLSDLFHFSVQEQQLLIAMPEIRDGLSLVLDQPKWFMREGQLTLNLFVHDLRLFSLVFSLGRKDGQLSAWIGAIQGRDYEGALNDYKELTKLAHGMRPRDLLFELFRMLCELIGVAQIFAVADEYRHHRSKYFGDGAKKSFGTNYNEIWEDRGGVRIDQAFYSLEVKPQHRNLSMVAAKKRGMYRRRYELLSQFHQRLETRLNQPNLS